MKDLTDEELHQAKLEGMPGSDRWIWAEAEEQRRERLKKKKSPFPHSLTIFLTLIGLAIAGLTYYNNFMKTKPAPAPPSEAEKAAQRAYVTYDAKVTNPEEAVAALRMNKDFFLRYQVTVTNSGLTPANSVVPDINFAVDPDWTAIMVTFPNDQSFDLAPKETRTLPGQALFKKFRQVRKFPGVSTGLQGDVEYRDVFKEAQRKDVCFTIEITPVGVSTGVCGTVFQQWSIK